MSAHPPTAQFSYSRSRHDGVQWNFSPAFRSRRSHGPPHRLPERQFISISAAYRARFHINIYVPPPTTRLPICRDMAGYSDSVSNSSPPHMMILVGVVGMILAVPAILAEQPSLPEVVGAINPAMAIIAPVLLIVVIGWLSSNSYSIIADPIFRATDSWSIHRAGGSPVGLALAILVVLVMVWHKSSGEDASE